MSRLFWASIIAGFVALLLYQKLSSRTPIHDKLEITFNSGVAALNAAQIPFTLAYGTALGIRRDNSLIPGDNDVDFMVFYEDLPLDADGNIDHARLNGAMNDNGLVSSGGGDPFVWSCEGKTYPVMYQYYHKDTHIGTDVYILYTHEQTYWEFSDGGERTGMGLPFPILPLDVVRFRKTRFKTWPKEWLDLQYGDWKTPVKGEKGRPVVPIKHTSDCVLPPP